jgi:hypothetical protein
VALSFSTTVAKFANCLTEGTPAEFMNSVPRAAIPVNNPDAESKFTAIEISRSTPLDKPPNTELVSIVGVCERIAVAL